MRDTLTASMNTFWFVSKPSGAIQLWYERNCSATVTQQRETCISHAYAETIYLSRLSRYFSTVAAAQNYININTTAAVCIKKYTTHYAWRTAGFANQYPLGFSPTTFKSIFTENFLISMNTALKHSPYIFRNHYQC